METKLKIAENCSIFVQKKREKESEREKEKGRFKKKTHAKNNPIKKHIC